MTKRQSDADARLAEADRLRAQWKAASLRAAVQKCREALALFKKTRDKNGQARALMKAGELLAILGEHKEARWQDYLQDLAAKKLAR